MWSCTLNAYNLVVEADMADSRCMAQSGAENPVADAYAMQIKQEGNTDNGADARLQLLTPRNADLPTPLARYKARPPVVQALKFKDCNSTAGFCVSIPMFLVAIEVTYSLFGK